jgi:hypothetical protein
VQQLGEAALRVQKIAGYQRQKKLIREALRQLDRPALKTMRWLHHHFAKAPPPKQGQHQTPAYAMPMLTLDIMENSIGRAIKGRSKLTRAFKSLPAARCTIAVVASIGGVLAGFGFDQLIH